MDATTSQDSCAAGVCVGTAIDRCAGVTCPVASSTCKVAGTCAAGSCGPETNAVNSMLCDDGDPTTDSDMCVAGTCAGTVPWPGDPQCFRGCDTDLADAATDAGVCAAAGAECVFDANADTANGMKMCAPPDQCPTSRAAMMAAMMASADPATFIQNADGSVNLNDPTVTAWYQCMVHCQMPDDTACSAEIAGIFANAGAGVNAVRWQCRSFGCVK